jgi:hypothetical protein
LPTGLDYREEVTVADTKDENRKKITMPAGAIRWAQIFRDIAEHSLQACRTEFGRLHLSSAAAPPVTGAFCGVSALGDRETSIAVRQLARP